MTITAKGVQSFAEKQLKIILRDGFQGRCFLAGGCFKSLIHGKEPNDLDLWPASSEDRILLLKSLQSQGSVVVEDGPFNTVVKHPSLSFHLEITYKCPPSLEECVADFDIELSCVAAEYFNGSVVGVYIHPGVADCIALQEIRTVSRLCPMKYSLRTLGRLEKYGRELGFGVCEQSRRRVWNIYTAASEPERTELLVSAAGLLRVPESAAIQRAFLDGTPEAPCRPFTQSELDALRRALIASSFQQPCSDHRRPVAIYVVGLPGAGKGTVLKEILRDLGVSWERSTNLDMDFIRSFHGQFTQYIRGDYQESTSICHIYKDLTSWFNKGSNAEQVLYKDDTSIVVRDVLSRKRDFILPVHTLSSLDFMKFTSSFGYVPYLVEIRVPLPVAQQRAITRAKVTGRYTPPKYIEEQARLLPELLSALKDFVEGQPGGVVACFDNSREGGGGLGSPVRMYPS